MTITNQTNRVTFTGNGVATNFPFSFPFYDESHIVVTLITVATGVEQVVSSGAYTLNGVDDPNGGSVDYSAITSAYQLQIERIIPYTQETDIHNQGAFLPEVIEQQFDLIVMQQIQQNTDLLDEAAIRAAADVLLGARIDGAFDVGVIDPDASVKDFASRAAAILISIPSGITYLRTAGYATAGDKGGALYKKVVAQPSHAGKLQSADTAWWEIVEDVLTPFMFGAEGLASGAVGNGDDDTVAVTDCFDCAVALDAKVSLASGNFRITDTVYARNINVDFDGGRLDYDGPRDRVAFEVGDAAGFTVGQGVSQRQIKDIWVRGTAISWGDTDYIGVRLTDVNLCNISFVGVQNFARGVQLYSYNSNCAYNDFHGGHFLDNQYHWHLLTDGSVVGANEFMNENTWYSGRYANSSVASALGSSYGVVVEAVNAGYDGHNNNRWFAPCFELGNGSGGDIRAPFWFKDAGGHFQVYSCRYEGGRGYFAYIDGTTRVITDNDFEIGYSAGSFITLAVLETGLAAGNRVRLTFTTPEIQQAVSFDVNQCVSAYSATETSVRGGLCALNSASADPALFQTGITGRKNSVRLGANRGLGFYVDCAGGETFLLSTETEGGFTGRPSVALFDVNGVRLTNVSAGAPHLISPSSAGSVTWSANYGGVYFTSSDQSNILFRISTDVRSIRVAAQEGTADCHLKRISLVRLVGDNRFPLHTYSGLDHDIFTRKATNPTSGIVGRYGIGDLIYNAAAASAAVSYWQCTTAGRLASAWNNNGAYIVGDLVKNDTNKIYICTVAGTSAGAGGPTGTGTGIVDNTVTWDYLSPLAVFTPGPNVP